MLEPVKFLFILTGASTYLVTKYIKVGLDDPDQRKSTNNSNSHSHNNNNNNQTLFNNTAINWNQSTISSWNNQSIIANNFSQSSSSSSYNYEDVRKGHQIHKFDQKPNGLSWPYSNQDHQHISRSKQRQPNQEPNGQRHINNDRNRLHHHRKYSHRKENRRKSNEPNIRTTTPNSYYIALITPSPNDSGNDGSRHNSQQQQKYPKPDSSSNSITIDNESRRRRKQHLKLARRQQLQQQRKNQGINWPTFEIEINEEDDRSLPKRLLQITLTNDDSSNIVDDEHNIRYYITGQVDDDDEDDEEEEEEDADNNGDDDRFIQENFWINITTGEIFVLKPLDRDPPNGHSSLKLSAYAQNIRSKQILGFADIWIHLRNINDNVPFFPQTIYYANVTENGTIGMKVIQMKAIDFDEEFDDDDDDDGGSDQYDKYDNDYGGGGGGSNDDVGTKLIYSIEQNQINEFGRPIFAIDRHNGWIKTNVCCLDRELYSNYTIVVGVQDSGGFKANTTVIVRLVDLNDCPPRFIQKEWHLEVDENSTESLALLFNDEINHNGANNGSYNLFDGYQSKVLLKLMVQDEDLPETNRFLFRIIEQRWSSKPIFKSSSSSSKIQNDDDNDEMIEKNHFTLEQQSTMLDNSNLNPGSKTSALLLISNPLDYEIAQQRFILLKIAVTDQGVWPSLHSEENTIHQNDDHFDICFIYIKVRDLNDNRPEFVQPFMNVSLMENVPIGTIVGKFLAKDSDQNGHSPLQYWLDPATNYGKYFIIDSRNGFVMLNRLLDRETIPMHVVNVIVSDIFDGQPSLSSTATLLINVDDINDNAPYLINNTLPSIRENSYPTKLGMLQAFDRDDYSKGNGPPFKFAIDPEADPDVHRKFRLEQDNKGAWLYTRMVLDRENQKQYRIPVVVTDSGSQSATSFVTVTVGDINDNDMKDGWKNVQVYYVDFPPSSTTKELDHSRTKNPGYNHNIKSLPRPIELGQINVEDPDDWDLIDKKFSWADHARNSDEEEADDDDGGGAWNRNHSYFHLDYNRGMVLAKRLVKGEHQLKFEVFDRRFQHRVHSTMNIQIDDIPLKAIINSGSLRIRGISSIDFIEIWDWKTRRKIISFKERLELSLKRIINCDQLEIISIVDRFNNQLQEPWIDVRYFAKRGDHFLSPVLINSVVQLKVKQLFQDTRLLIEQVGINECMREEHHQCEQQTNCFTEVQIDWTNPYRLINANFTSFVGINLITKAKCNCFYNELLNYFDQKSVCDIDQILCTAPTSSSFSSLSSPCSMQEKINLFTRGQITSVTSLNYRCLLMNQPQDYNHNNHNNNHHHHHHHPLNLGATNVRSFKSDGIVWLDPLPICTENLLSIQISTTEPNGIIFYYGPIISSSNINSGDKRQIDANDFMFLELINGSPRLLFDFGSGTQEITLDSHSLNDGNWHQLDIYFDSNIVHLMLDTCIGIASGGGTKLMMQYTNIENRKCHNHSIITKFQHVLNVNAPLQLGGIGINSSLDLLQSIPTSILEQLRHSSLTILNFQTPLRSASSSSSSSSSSVHRHSRIVGGFTGCIRNLIFNNHVYDLINVPHSHNTQIGCHSSNSLCSFLNQRCLNHGYCDGSYNQVKCHCAKGFYGQDCAKTFVPVLFRPKSFIQLSLQKRIRSPQSPITTATTTTFDPTEYYHNAMDSDGYLTKIDFHFRTRQWQAQLIRMVGQNPKTYCLVEIRDGRLVFRFNLNPNLHHRSERKLMIDTFVVNDGRWHHVVAFRYGQNGQVTLDQGGIGKSKRTIEFPEPPLLWGYQRFKPDSDGFWKFDLNPNTIILGGEVNYLGATTNIVDDFADGCLSDLKINDIDVPLGELIRSDKNNNEDNDKIVPDSTKMSKTVTLNKNRTIMLYNKNNDNGAGTFIEISIIKQQNVNDGCLVPVDSCAQLHCKKPFRCVDEWMLAKCRCPKGFVESDDGKSCVKNLEYCRLNPCVCAGQSSSSLTSATNKMVKSSQHESLIQGPPPPTTRMIGNDSAMSRLLSSLSSSSNGRFHKNAVNDDDDDCQDGGIEESEDTQQNYLIEEENSNNRINQNPNDNRRDNNNNNHNNNILDANNNNKNKNRKQLSTLNARILNQLEHYGLFFILILVLIPLNIPFIVYIGYICVRNRRQRNSPQQQQQQQPPHPQESSANQRRWCSSILKSSKTNASAGKSNSNFNEDIRENVVCYHDEGGGECDVGAYDMVPLRIQIHQLHHGGNIINQQHQQQQQHYHLQPATSYEIGTEQELNPIMNSMNYNKSEIGACGGVGGDRDDVWQEFTVI